MRLTLWLWLAAVLVPVAGCGPGAPGPVAQQALASPSTPAFGSSEYAGKTQPAPGRVGKVAPVVLHPVVEVLVVPGTRVTKGQALVHMDDDEPRADVRSKAAALKELEASLERLKAEPRQAEQDEARANRDAARISAREARRHLARLTPLWVEGAIAEQSMYQAQATLAKTEAEERAASARLEHLLQRAFPFEVRELEARIAAAGAALDAAKAELEHYTMVAPIDGVVTTLHVSPGTVSRPGTSVWGEILDLREIDARCELTPRQLDGISVGQTAEVSEEARPEMAWAGRVVSISLAADAATGRVPVLVRVDNPQERLRCYVPVRVRFRNLAAEKSRSQRTGGFMPRE